MIIRRTLLRIPKTKNKAAADHPDAHFVDREDGGCFYGKAVGFRSDARI